ncbi:toll/interleukin-1 receptor domain-containing protein [Streptomyces alkaliphilus]|uniref:toll/interleukin-1 receptor domain-containing protein n=1 Tax=Streptomyces alkaliphilus TaxID=1472722 RepID=UPI0015662629
MFISYTESDLGWAKWVTARIEEAGHVVMMQHWDSPPGENFVAWVNEQLGMADLVMPLYSREYFESRWCTIEWTAALSANKRIVPLKVGPCEIPPVLTNITFVDVSRRSEKSMKHLMVKGLGTPAENARRERVGESPEVRAERLVRRWRRAALLATAIGLIGTAVVFNPNDPEGSGDVASGFDANPLS